MRTVHDPDGPKLMLPREPLLSASHQAVVDVASGLSYPTEMDERQKYHLPSAVGEAFVTIMDVACGEERSLGKVTTPSQPPHHVREA